MRSIAVGVDLTEHAKARTRQAGERYWLPPAFLKSPALTILSCARSR